MAGIFIGNTELSSGDIRSGNTNISAVYYGSTQIFPSAASTFSVTVTISGTLTNASRSTNSLTINSGSSATFTVQGNTNYKFTAASQSSATESSSHISVSESFNSTTGVFTYTVTAGNLTSNQTATITNAATAPQNMFTVSGTITDAITNATIATPLTYSVTGLAGSTQTFTKTITPASNYSHGSYTVSNTYITGVSRSGNTVTFTLTIPGNITGNVTNNFTVIGAAIEDRFSGNITYNTASNVTADVAPTSYSSETVGTSIAYSGTLNAASGYVFSGGLNRRAVSGNVSVPSNGGNLTVNLASNTVQFAGILSNINPTTISVGGGGGDRTITFTQTGSAVPTFSSLPSWITVVGTLTSSSTSAVIRIAANTGSERNDGIVLSKGGVNTVIQVSQAAAIAPATSGSIGGNVEFDLGVADSVKLNITVNSSGQWNLTGGGNNITISPNTGVGNTQVTVTYNGASNAKDGLFRLRAGTTVGSGSILDTEDLIFTI